MEIQYNKCGDYYLPNLIIEDSAQRSIGKYGRLHRQYLKEHRPMIFTTLFLSGKLYEHLTEINRACTERMELLTRQMAEREGVTETLKAADQMNEQHPGPGGRDCAERACLLLRGCRDADSGRALSRRRSAR